MQLRNTDSLEENKLSSNAMKNEEAAKFIKLMDNKGTDQKVYSMHEDTQESKLKDIVLMNTKTKLRNYLLGVPG